MQPACSTSRVSPTYAESIVEVLHVARSSTCYNGYWQRRQLRKRPVGIAGFHSVVIHAGEKYFASSSVGHLSSPIEQTAFGALSSTLYIAIPFAISLLAFVNSTYAHLRTELRRYFVYKLRVAYCSRVDAHLVGSCIQQTLNIRKGVDATANSKRDVYYFGYSFHHLGECIASFSTCCDVEKHQFVSSLFAISSCKLHGVACVAQILEVDTLNGLSVFHIKAWYDSFGKSHNRSFF